MQTEEQKAAFLPGMAAGEIMWAEGYTERYGLIYTDFRILKRTVKDSGLWYSRVAASNRLDV